MKLEDQVLSINQVQELQELGFDVKKNASMVWINNRLFSKDDTTTQCMIVQVDYTPTMTIGDIIEVLPKMIGVYSIEFDFIGNQVYIDYIYRRESLLKLDHIFDMDNKESVTFNLTNALFETLKWCIVNKRITIQKYGKRNII